MRVEGHKVILERKDCHVCDENGTNPSVKFKTCPKCKGTGKRGNGRCRECNDRGGYYIPGTFRPGQVVWYDHEDRVPCRRCGGNNKDYEPENYTDNVDVSFLPVEVVRRERGQSWVEQHLGLGVYTIVDYGRHKNMTDEEIAAPVIKELKNVQACKVVRSKEDLTICDKIVIVTADSGYSAVPFWENND